MKSVKLRAWNGSKMLHTHKAEFYLSANGKCDIPNSTGHEFKELDYPVMLWTGLYDRTGTPIFEGDVNREEIEFDEGDERIYYVCRWFPQTCSFVWMTYGDTCTDWDNTPEDYPTNVLLAETDKYTICCNEYEKPDWWQLD